MNKIDLTDVSFLIAIKIDSKDRVDNLDIVINYLQHHFDTEIIISEQSNTPQLKGRYDCKYIHTSIDEFFNRQKGVNIAARESTNPIIAHYDADVLLTPKQVIKTVQALRDSSLEFVLPYDGYFYDIPKHLHDKIKDTHSIEWLNVNDCRMMNPGKHVGGVVFFNREAFWRCGGANENFKGLGYEDNEIFERFRILKASMGRVTQPLFHLTHVRKETSYDYNPYVKDNRDECLRVNQMTTEQLRLEVNNWEWVKAK